MNTDEETKRILKAAFKEGLQEWLDVKWAEFGKWTATGIAVLAFGALVALIMWANGYHK